MATSSFDRRFVVRGKAAIEMLKLVLAQKVVLAIATRYSEEKSKKAAAELAEKLRDESCRK